MRITGRNVGLWQISQDKNISTEAPLQMRFFVPPTANGLKHMPLSYSITDFESYTNVTGAAGAHNHQIQLPTHSHSFNMWVHSDANTNEQFAVAIQKLVDEWSFVVAQGADAIVLSDEGGNEITSSDSENEHYHEVSAELKRTSWACDYIKIEVDGTDVTIDIESTHGTVRIPEDSDIDIMRYLSTPVVNKWHEVKIIPMMYDSEKQALCYMYAYISPEMARTGL